MTDANPQLSGSETAQHHTPRMEISHKWGRGGCCLSLPLSLSCTPCFHGNSTDRNYDWLKLLSEIQAEMYVEFPVRRCYAVMESVLCLPLVYASQAEVSCCCKAKSTLNMSLVRLSHAEDGGGKIREEGRGGKAPQETNPSSVGGRDANPQ